jgi:CRP-like cAMP-binding protein
MDTYVQHRGAVANSAFDLLMTASWASLQQDSSVIPKAYLPGVEVFRQGCPAREVHCIDRGLVKLIRLDEDGQELIVGLHSRGAILGAASLIVGKPHPVTAKTLSECSIQQIPRDAFLDLAMTDGRFAWYLQQFHSSQVYDQAAHLAGLKYRSARQRLERALWQLMVAVELDKRPAPVKFAMPLKYWEIAQLIAVTPEHLSRVLKELEHDGVVVREKNNLLVYDLEALRGWENDG